MIKRKRLAWLAGAIILIVGLGAIAMQPLLQKVFSRLRTYVPLPVYEKPIVSDGDYTNIIFLHHSTGRALIAEGNVRPLLTELGYQFWDHGYNFEGLVRPDGTQTYANYRIPGNRGQGNTDVDGLVDLFTQPITDPPSNALSRLLQHDVIIFKSCFPNSAIEDDATLEQFKDWYLEIRAIMDQHPDHIFILVTSPPLHPLATDLGEAARAQSLVTWLKSDKYLKGHPNVFVFDLFGHLIDPETNMLSDRYQIDPDKPDSHPNKLANEEIGPIFVAFIDEAVRSYRNSRPDSP